jgi:integrase/recombinase XerD
VREVWNGFQTWMRDDKGFSVATRQGYMRRVQQAHRWLRSEGHPGVHLATDETLRAWWDSITPSPQNRSHARGALVTFFRYVNAAGWRPDNPADALPKLKLPRGVPRPVPKPETLQLLQMAEVMGPMTSAIVHVLAYCGLRNAELRALQWTSLERGVDGGMWLRVMGKGSRERMVPVPQDCLDSINRWRRVSGSVEHMFHAATHEERPLSESTLAYLLRELAGLIGVEKLTPHMLRHTYATELLEITHDITIVQQGLGHASPATSMIYARVNPTRLGEASGGPVPGSRKKQVVERHGALPT